MEEDWTPRKTEERGDFMFWKFMLEKKEATTLIFLFMWFNLIENWKKAITCDGQGLGSWTLN